ncbi:MAG TPA: hypothetical protein VL985_09155 [Stellaceae bacterium]|nr:hypothetical protein [Stellaceae bacterium]
MGGELGRTRWQLLPDLFTNNAGAFELGDSQMVVPTAAAIALYVVTNKEVKNVSM